MSDGGERAGSDAGSHERLGIAGSGAIACGLAVTAAQHGPVALWARSPSSAERAQRTVDKLCGKLDDGPDPALVRIETELDALGEASVVVEAIAEDQAVKSRLLQRLREVADGDALLATTTSSLSVRELARVSGAPERFVGLHVFNPVPRMKLVELAFPDEATERTRERAHALCTALDKIAVEVPDTRGFVVNRLLFPFLFEAVELMQRTDLAPADVDTCMTLGAGHPMGPLALLDFVGLDVSIAIGDALGLDVPARLRELVAEGSTGRKSGRGLYDYDGG